MRRTHTLAGAALSAALVSWAATPALAADATTCDALTARYETRRVGLEPPQVSAVLFAAAEDGCDALAERVLDAGASVAARDRAGGTALTHAARGGHVALIKLLVARGADVDLRNDEGSTPLFVAVEQNRFGGRRGADRARRQGESSRAGGSHAVVGRRLQLGLPRWWPAACRRSNKHRGLMRSSNLLRCIDQAHTIFTHLRTSAEETFFDIVRIRVSFRTEAGHIGRAGDGQLLLHRLRPGRDAGRESDDEPDPEKKRCFPVALSDGRSSQDGVLPEEIPSPTLRRSPSVQGFGGDVTATLMLE